MQVHEALGACDGDVLPASLRRHREGSEPTTLSLRDGAQRVPLLEGLDGQFVRAERDRASGGLFLSLDFEAKGSKKREAACHDIALGALPAGAKLVALARIKRWWMAPTFPAGADDVPVETQLLLVELPPDGIADDDADGAVRSAAADRRYAVVLPLIDYDSGFRATLFGADGGAPAARGSGVLAARVESGDPSVRAARVHGALFVAGGRDPHEVRPSPGYHMYIIM
jgi:raffinose synthase